MRSRIEVEESRLRISSGPDDGDGSRLERNHQLGPTPKHHIPLRRPLDCAGCLRREGSPFAISSPFHQFACPSVRLSISSPVNNLSLGRYALLVSICVPSRAPTTKKGIAMETKRSSIKPAIIKLLKNPNSSVLRMTYKHDITENKENQLSG